MKTSATMSFFILALTLVVIPLIAEAEESDDAKKAAEDFFLAMTQS
jgi:O-antigen/teichoic acid export membrane protein